MARQQTRAADRTDISGPIALAWETERGEWCYQQAVAKDLSSGGVGVYLRNPLAPRLLVSVVQENSGIRRLAVVRHCIRKGGKYLIGLEFSDKFVH